MKYLVEFPFVATLTVTVEVSDDADEDDAINAAKAGVIETAGGGLVPSPAVQGAKLTTMWSDSVVWKDVSVTEIKD